MEQDKNVQVVEQPTQKDVQNGAPVKESDEKKSEEKTLTQTEFNVALKKAIELKTKNMPKDDELKEFNDWKESKKTDEQKKVEELQKQNNIINENTLLKQQNACLKKNVDSKYIDFVQFEVSRMEGDFNDNLDNYLKENPTYLGSKEDAKKSTGFPQNGINKPVTEEKAYLDKKYANNPYYKKD